MFANLIDTLLFLILVLTIGLIVFKVIQLYFGEKLLKKPTPASLAKQATGDLISDRKIRVDEALERLEQGMALLATLASAAPFIGLMGTVMHIIAALSKISGANLDISLISGPIATALNATLIGLVSAVPAAIAYNLFVRKIQLMDNAARRIFERELPKDN